MNFLKLQLSKNMQIFLIRPSKYMQKLCFCPENQNMKVATFWRYVEAINRTFCEEDTKYIYEITDWNDTTIDIDICCRN